MSRLTASRAAFDLIASFEGFRARAAMAPNGKWTLGFGHSATAREGLSVTRGEAEDLLRWDLLPIEDLIRQSALTPLTQNQFDALCSFAFNIGTENFKSSEVLRFLNQGQPIAAALAMHAWRLAKVNDRILVIDALVRRRAAETALFLEPFGARAAAPSSVLHPELDYSASLLGHCSDPSHVVSSLEGEISSVVVTRPPSALATQSESKVENSILPVKSALIEPSIGPVLEGVEAETAIEVAPTPGRVDEDKGVQDAPIKTVAEAQIEPKRIGEIEAPVISEALVLAQPDATAFEAANTDVPTDVLQARTNQALGLAPFPGTNGAGTSGDLAANQAATTAFFPANDAKIARVEPQTVSDGARLNAQPITLNSSPAGEAQGSSYRLIMIALIALGALLLAGGLSVAGSEGLLKLVPNRPPPTPVQMGALLASAIGFVTLATSLVAYFRGGPVTDDI